VTLYKDVIADDFITLIIKKTKKTWDEEKSQNFITNDNIISYN